MSEQRFGILIASSRFPNESELEDLRCPENDVDGLHDVLSSKDRGGFTETIVLKNQPHHEVLKNINRILKQAHKEDLVLIFYSGHGKLDLAGRLHLATVDTELDALESTSIPVESIRNFIDVSPPNKSVLLLDCCYSGAVEKALLRGGVQEQLQNISGGRGIYILTGSTDIQVAQEKESDQYGLFSKHVIVGLREGEADQNGNGLITMDDLYGYVHEKVLEEGPQEPMRWAVGVRGNLIISRSGKTPRKERAKQIREIIFELAKKGFLPNDIFDKARQVIALEQDQLDKEDRTYDRLLDQLLKKSLEPGEFIRKWDRVRRRQEREKKLREEEQRTVAEERQSLEEEKQRLAEQKRKSEEKQKRKEAARKAEEERKQEQERKLKADEEKRCNEEEELKRQAEEERKKKEAAAKRKAEEERKKKEIEAKRKIEEKRKRKEAEQKSIEAAHKVEEEGKQKEAEAKRKADEEERKRREAEVETKLNRPEPVKVATKGKIVIETAPKNANIKMLNIDQDFQQGMELWPGNYHAEVSLEGYKTQKKKIDISSGEEKRIKFKLNKISQKIVSKTNLSPKTITNSIGMKFALIPSGRFIMGFPVSFYFGQNRKEYVEHEVYLTKQFYLQISQVTQGQWEKVMGDNPSEFINCGNDCPVEKVSWNDTQKFISKLNQIEETNKYRLPTEAEWEYSCRAGRTSEYSFGNGTATIDQYAWYSRNSKKQTHPVGQKKPNNWGLYDMHGNVWEWCHDWFGDYSEPWVDPKGPIKKGLWLIRRRVNRGGSWFDGAQYAGSAYRGGWPPNHKFWSIGFRVARDF